MEHQTVKKSVTLYKDQLSFLQDYADKHCRGKLSRALQEIVDKQKANDEADEEDTRPISYPNSTPTALTEARIEKDLLRHRKSKCTA